MPAKSFFILLADDDPEDLELFEEAILQLEPEARVNYVVNGKGVMEFLAACSDDELPDLIIMDYNMPQMTGVDVLTRLNGICRYKPIVKLILSTSCSETHIKKSLDNGARDYFVKPDNFIELKILVKKMLSMCSAG
ncbi:MAG: response regulator [Ferruginibacter sp.]